MDTERGTQSFNYNPNLLLIGPRQLKWNIVNSFSIMFITMLSIIHGIVFSKFGTEIISHGFTSNLDCVDCLAKYVSSFLILVMVWHSYFWLAAIAKWPPSFVDSVFMFVVGVAEYTMIHNIHNGHWWYYCVYSIGYIGAIQYMYNVDCLKGKYKEKCDKIENHILTYKKKRSEDLIFLTSIFLGVTILLHWKMPDALIVMSLIILAAQSYPIYRNFRDRYILLSELERL